MADEKKKEKTPVEEFLSAVRWNKTKEEINKALGSLPIDSKDPVNGNTCVHLAAQNGHLNLLMFLIEEKKANINAQNANGQTALHMSVEYDFYKQTKYMLGHGADKEIKNNDGHRAIDGIEGKCTGSQAWDNPIVLLRVAFDKSSLDAAFTALEKTPSKDVDKALLVQTGMAQKKKLGSEGWDQDRFKALITRA